MPRSPTTFASSRPPSARRQRTRRSGSLRSPTAAWSAEGRSTSPRTSGAFTKLISSRRARKAPSRGPASRIGRSLTPTSSLTTRKPNGSWACRGRRARARSIHRGRSRIRCRQCRSSPAECSSSRARASLGIIPSRAPVAVISQSYQGRMPCAHCGFCMGFGCEMGAKSSPLPYMIPQAIATGRCEIRPHSYVRKIELDTHGRADRRDLFRQERQGEPATRACGRRRGQWLGDAKAIAALQVEPLPGWSGQFQRPGGQVPHVQHQFPRGRTV